MFFNFSTFQICINITFHKINYNQIKKKRILNFEKTIKIKLNEMSMRIFLRLVKSLDFFLDEVGIGIIPTKLALFNFPF